MKSLVEFISCNENSLSIDNYINEGKINAQDVIDTIVGAYQQWEADLEDEPGQWADIEDMYTAKEPSEAVIKDICGDLGVKAEELAKFFNTSQGKSAWKEAQKQF